MKKWLLPTAIFLFCLAVFGIATSWKSASQNETKISSAGIEESSARPVAKDAVNQKRELTSVIHVLLDSHQIFSEAWRLLLGSRSSIPNSAMKALSNRLTQHLGQRQDVLAEVIQCPKPHDILQMTDTPQGHEISLQHKSCVGPTSDLVASVHWSSRPGKDAGYKMSLEIHPNQIVEGVGESLALLNATITCDVGLSDNERIEDLTCKNLGQGTERAQHYTFSRFEYRAKEHDLLIVDADRFINLMEKTTCTSKQACFQLRVPLAGKIKIVENHKMGLKPVPVVAAAPILIPPPLASVPGVAVPAVPTKPLLPGIGTTPERTSTTDLNSDDAQGISQSSTEELEPIPGVSTDASAGESGEEGEPHQQEAKIQAPGQEPPSTPAPTSNIPGARQAHERAQAGQDAGDNSIVDNPQGLESAQQDASQSGSAAPEAVVPAPLISDPNDANPTIQPVGDAREDLQPRQPSGEKAVPVLLPEGSDSGLHDGRP